MKLVLLALPTTVVYGFSLSSPTTKLSQQRVRSTAREWTFSSSTSSSSFPWDRHSMKPLWSKASESNEEGDSNDDDQSQSAALSTVLPNHALSDILAIRNVTLEFPALDDLLQLGVGDYVTSKPIVVSTENDETFQFRVKLYPRGGGHRSQHTMMEKSNDNQREQSGFGMSYQVLPSWLGGTVDQRVGVYLQFEPEQSSRDTVDASFALRLKGQQRVGPRFDVEWRAGIRFVSLENSKLKEGRANDFGAHLMQTQILDFFLGLDDGDDDATIIVDPARRREPVRLDVEIYLHAPYRAPEQLSNDRGAALEESSTSNDDGIISRGFGVLRLDDMRNQTATATTEEPLRVGEIVVPVLRKLSQRPQMFQDGVYPGVEYRILRMIDPATERDVFYTRPGVDYELKPIYPLVRQLERPWPVRVPESDIPKLITPTQYNLVSAVGSLFTALTGLTAAFLLSQAISLFFIPSRSMEPTLQVGDVLLVEKVTPRVLPFLRVGEVILFHPPEKLQKIVEQSGGRVNPRDLFVKRIAGAPGDVLEVSPTGDVQVYMKDEDNPNGDGGRKVDPTSSLIRRDLCTAEPLRLIERYITPGSLQVQRGEVAVLGDCASVSVDSRVWGSLPTSDIVGRPLLRVWPLERFGPLTTPTVHNTWAENDSP